MKAPVSSLVSVAILTWNRKSHVLKAIQSVVQQSYPNVEIVVVDSASTDGTADAVRAAFPSVTIIRLPRNLGCPEGRNVALANCLGEYIFALDDDGWIPSTTLATIVDRFESHPEAGVVACRILAPEESADCHDQDLLHYTFSGGASAIRRAALERVGYYPSDYFRQGEETDLALRLYDAGYVVLRCPEAIMYHEASPINRNQKLFWFYSSRNELYTVIRRYPWFLIAPGCFQKAISWIGLGLRRGALFHICAGIISAGLYLPRLLASRRPVSAETIRRVLAIKWSSPSRKGNPSARPNEDHAPGPQNLTRAA